MLTEWNKQFPSADALMAYRPFGILDDKLIWRLKCLVTLPDSNLTGGFTYGSLFNGVNEIEGETRETNSMVWTAINGNNYVIRWTRPITFLSLQMHVRGNNCMRFLTLNKPCNVRGRAKAEAVSKTGQFK